MKCLKDVSLICTVSSVYNYKKMDVRLWRSRNSSPLRGSVSSDSDNRGHTATLSYAQIQPNGWTSHVRNTLSEIGRWFKREMFKSKGGLYYEYGTKTI